MIKKQKFYIQKHMALKLSIMLCLVIALVFLLYIINNVLKISEIFYDSNNSVSAGGDFRERGSILKLIKEVPIVGAMFFYFVFTLIPIPVSVQYLVSKYKKTIAVYKFSGYDERSIFVKILKYCSVALLFVILLSNLIYLLLERVWFNNIMSFFGTYNLTFIQYVATDLLFALIILIFMTPIISQIKATNVEYNDE